MELTKEMKEMMERTMEEYFSAYWTKHATPEQEAKRVAEGKTFKGAFAFAKSVAEHYRNKPNGENCVAMPDDLAYWILMEYMESVPEGETYRTAEEIEEARKREAEAAERKRREAEEKARKKREELENKAKKLSEGSLLAVTADDVAKAEAEAEKAKKAAKAVRDSIKAEKEKANKIAEKVEAAQLSLF